LLGGIRAGRVDGGATTSALFASGVALEPDLVPQPVTAASKPSQRKRRGALASQLHGPAKLAKARPECRPAEPVMRLA
jgi:hypothetical protein